jgi:glycosyltransferase involved in cell wall biosynthesis
VSHDLVCLSHLRWGFVFQRPNHLMARFASARRTFFVEEPTVDPSTPVARMQVTTSKEGVHVCTPQIPAGLDPRATLDAQRTAIDALLRDRQVSPSVLWFYTPMALGYAGHLDAPLVVYDCMDELSAFAGAPAELPAFERELLARAHLVFTGGQSLYERKRRLHPQVHAFPSSVDAEHFAHARERLPDPGDQAAIPHPRAGYFGVIDERIDLELIAMLASARPELHLVFLGPLAKRSASELPRRENIHWLGMKPYAELPSYLANWEVALMPFALNDATRFISPTKTLEYLAAGKPVVSTAIRDVVTPYGDAGLVHIADERSFAEAVDAALRTDRRAHHQRADALVAQTSWDATWSAMNAFVESESLARTAHLYASGGGARGRCSTT